MSATDVVVARVLDDIKGTIFTPGVMRAIREAREARQREAGAAPKPLPCSLCGRRPRAMGGRDLHCVDCAARVAIEEATL